METYTTGTGQVLHGVHSPKHCKGRHCVIHNPSDHHMSSWPTNWRGSDPFDIVRVMERICKHGVGHPDPDDVAWNKLRGQNVSIHGCDGCCKLEGDNHGKTTSTSTRSKQAGKAASNS